MDSREFKQWSAEYFRAFPGTANWLASTETPDATLAVWQRTLATVPLVVASTVLDRMIDGQFKPPESYDMDKTALVIRAYALPIMAKEAERLRAERERAERKGAAGGSKSQFPAGELYRRCAWIRMKADEEYPDDAARATEWYNATSGQILNKWIKDGGDLPPLTPEEIQWRETERRKQCATKRIAI